MKPTQSLPEQIQAPQGQGHISFYALGDEEYYARLINGDNIKHGLYKLSGTTLTLIKELDNAPPEILKFFKQKIWISIY